MENFTRGLESIKKKSDGNLELKITERASLVVQWLRICLAMQGTPVRSLVQEDPTCRVATKATHHNH